MGIEMARAVEQRAAQQNAEKAIDIWKGLLRLQPHLPEAVESLKRLYTRTEKWNALLELLKEDLETVPAEDVDEKVNRLLDIVAIYRDRLNLDVMVVNTYLSIVALKPDHPAGAGGAGGALRGAGAVDRPHPDPHAAGRGGHRTAQRLALHRRVARCGRRSWASTRTRSPASRRSSRPIPRTRRPASGSRSCTRRAGRGSRCSRSTRESSRTSPRQSAATAWPRWRASRRAPQRDARGDQAVEPGAGDLAARSRDAGGPGEPLRARAALAGADRDPRSAAPERRRRSRGRAAAAGAAGDAALREAGARPRRAIEVFRRIQVLQPTHARAVRALREIYAQSGDFSALEALYVEQGAFGDLCDQLTALADRTADMTARTRMLERVATLSLEKLNQPERALKAYERDPGDRPAEPAGGDGADPALPDGAEVAAPAGDVRGAGRSGARGQTDGASARRAAAAVQRSAPHLRAAAGVEVAGVPVVRARLRAGAHRRRGDRATSNAWPPRPTSGARWPARATKRAAPSRRPTPRSGCGCCAGRCASPWARLYQPAGGARVRRADPRRASGHDEEAEAALEQILTQTKSWPDLAKLLHARADRATDLVERAKMLFRIAQFEEEKVARSGGRRPHAGGDHRDRATIGDKATNERAVRGLTRVLEARQDWAGLVGALRREIDSGAPRRARARSCCCASARSRRRASRTRPRRSRPIARSWRPTRRAPPAVAGLERLVAGGLDKASRSRAWRCRSTSAPTTPAQLAAAIETLLAVADSAASGARGSRSCARSTAGRSKNKAAAYATRAERSSRIDPADRNNREPLIHFAAETQAMPAS